MDSFPNWSSKAQFQCASLHICVKQFNNLSQRVLFFKDLHDKLIQDFSIGSGLWLIIEAKISGMHQQYICKRDFSNSSLAAIGHRGFWILSDEKVLDLSKELNCPFLGNPKSIPMEVNRPDKRGDYY